MSCKKEEEVDTSVTIWAIFDDMVNEESLTTYLASIEKKCPNQVYNIKILSSEDAQVQIRAALESENIPDIVFGRYSILMDTLCQNIESAPLQSFLPQSPLDAIRELSSKHSAFLPLAMNYTCMAVNLELMEDAGALQYIDEDDRSWSTDDFRSSVKALYSYGQASVASIYCGGQSGVDGLIALINNLYGGSLCDEDGNYTMNNEENRRSLDYLTDLSSIKLDGDIVGEDEVLLFSRGQYAMSFSWGPKNVDTEVNDFTAYTMRYPSFDGEGFLPGTIYGVVAFDTEIEEKQANRDDFLSSLYGDGYQEFIESTQNFPVETSCTVYESNEKMQPFIDLLPYVTVFYETCPNYESARAQWWQVMSAIGEGADIDETIAAFNWSLSPEN